MSGERKVALITGITGQDGSYLTEFLLEKGYIVHGIKRRTSHATTTMLDHILVASEDDVDPQHQGLSLHYGDVLDVNSLIRILQEVRPHEVYNLAAQSHVKVSFEVPHYTAEVSGLGALNVLEAIRSAGLCARTRYYQASTSELYGQVREVPQSEATPFHPRSPYAVAKLYAYWITQNYREAYGMFACNGILFNHESPRRSDTFVTRKVTLAAARIALGAQSCLYLGNLDVRRDWGHARDYVRAMWLMLQLDAPQDFVLATGVTTSVRSFAQLAFAAAGLPLRFSGVGLDEVGTVVSGPLAGRVVVRVSPAFFRPAEVDLLQGDPRKAQALLGWDPRATSVEALAQEMVRADLELVRRQVAEAARGQRQARARL